LSSQILLSGGDKYYSYSGELFGDVSVPATIPMITIDNTGLRDSLIQIQPYFGQLVNTSNNEGLGIEIKLDNVTIFKNQIYQATIRSNQIENQLQFFAPRNSKLEVISNNTTGNNTQTRGVTLIGYYL
tara:strand:+ start:266 stop:649 length:384 start_codon:yes stop_codon:yes gene_type:complete